MGDDSIQGQLAEMSNNPEVLRQTQEQSEVLLKKVAGELVEGVKEYRDEFEPNADDLIAKFSVRELRPICTAPLSFFLYPQLPNSFINGACIHGRERESSVSQ